MEIVFIFMYCISLSPEGIWMMCPIWYMNMFNASPCVLSSPCVAQGCLHSFRLRAPKIDQFRLPIMRSWSLNNQFEQEKNRNCWANRARMKTEGERKNCTVTNVIPLLSICITNLLFSGFICWHCFYFCCCCRSAASFVCFLSVLPAHSFVHQIKSDVH